MKTITLHTFFPTENGFRASLRFIVYQGEKKGLNKTEREPYIRGVLANLYKGMNLYNAVIIAICDITINGIEQ